MFVTKLRRLTMIKEAGIIGWIIVVGLLVSFLTPAFYTSANIWNIIIQSSVVGIMAIGMTLIILTGEGGIDLSAGSILGISSVAMAMAIIPVELYRDTALTLNLPNDMGTIVLAIVICLLTGALCGLVNGVIIAFVKLPPFIATLAMMTAARGVAAYISAGIPTYGLPSRLVWVGQGEIAGFPVPVLIMLVLAVLVHIALTRTTFGICLFALGGNRETARFSGINVKGMLLVVYILGALFFAIAGIVLSARGNQVHPDAGLGYELYAIGATVVGGTSMLGGRGGVLGAILGAVFMAEVQNAINLLNIPVAYMKPILGALIIMAVLLDQWQKKRSIGD